MYRVCAFDTKNDQRILTEARSLEDARADMFTYMDQMYDEYIGRSWYEKDCINMAGLSWENKRSYRVSIYAETSCILDSWVLHNDTTRGLRLAPYADVWITFVETEKKDNAG